MTQTMKPPDLVVTVPGLRLKPPGNGREHWRLVSKRAKAEKAAVWAALFGHDPRPLREAHRCRVHFTRLGGKRMDSDNLVAALKHVRDAVSEWVGTDDGSDWWEWGWPEWEPGKPVGVRIEVWGLTP